MTATTMNGNLEGYEITWNGDTATTYINKL